MQAEVEEGEIVEEAEFVQQPSWKSHAEVQLERARYELDYYYYACRNSSRLAAEAHASSIDCERAKRKARELEGEVKRLEEELHGRQCKIVRTAKQRDAHYGLARVMFFASARALRLPNDEAKHAALAACSAHLRRVHDSRVIVQYGSGGRLPPNKKIVMFV